MKKILSSILAAATIFSVMLVPATAESTTSVTQKVDVLYMSTQPTFDGDIAAEEWGVKSFTVDGSKAAVPGDTAPSETNTFAWYLYEYDSKSKSIIFEDEPSKDLVKKLSYDVWLRWDTKYLYIATKVNDPDGYYLPAGREKIWDGDCVQFRVDPMGPNGYLSYKNPDYNYETDGFDFAASKNIGYVPWAYKTKFCNIGLGAVGGDTANAKNVQAYDMADQGTGKMTKQQLVNDPKKLGPNTNPLKDENDYASLFAMKITKNGNGSINTYECAVPWAFIDQWGLGQVAVGYTWGMSLVVLDGWANAPTKGWNGDSEVDHPLAGNAYRSYLTWGSGICGAQQDDAELNPTIGGSNAIILSDIDAISKEQVPGLPQVQEKGDDETVTHKIIDAQGMNAYYLSSGEYNAVDGDYELSFDVAYLGDDPINPDRTYVGSWLGAGYGMAAGWDADSNKFFVAEQLFNNGINKDISYAESDEEFDWPIGEWHNLTIKVKDKTVTIYLDGKVVLTDTDRRNECTIDTADYSIITYNIGDFVYDNYKVFAGGKTLCNFTCDSDDAEFNKSDFQLMAIPMFHNFIEGKCQRACDLSEDPNDTSLYGCLMHADVNAEGKPVMKCDFCGIEEERAIVYGDANGDNKVNINDATAMLKKLAKWDVQINEDAANTNGDSKFNISDVTHLLKYLAKWDVVLGPKA